MTRPGTTLALLLGLLVAQPAAAYRFAVQPLTDNDRSDFGLAVDGAIVAWESCEFVGFLSPPTCEIWAFDANQPELGPRQITSNEVRDGCVDVAGRWLIYHRFIGLGQVVLQDLDAGESILSSDGVDDSCPRLSSELAVWGHAGQVIVRDRNTGLQQAVASGSGYDVSGPFVVWQQQSSGPPGDLDVWFLDTTALPWTPQRLTTTPVRDQFAQVYAARQFVFFSTVWVPFVTWERKDGGGVAQVMLWDGTTTTQVTSSPLNQRNPQVSGVSATLFLNEQPTLAWISGGFDHFELSYCTVCDGNPDNNILLASNVYSHDVLRSWIAYAKGSGEISFFDGVDVTPVTTAPGDNSFPLLGFRSTPPVGPFLVWSRDDGSDYEIDFAPEPATVASGLAAAATLLGLRRRRPHRG